jgi:hypothetical protein
LVSSEEWAGLEINRIFLNKESIPTAKVLSRPTTFKNDPKTVKINAKEEFNNKKWSLARTFSGHSDEPIVLYGYNKENSAKRWSK